MIGSKLGNITFLSARPRLYQGALENKLFSDFARLKEQGRFHCMPAMLAGDTESGWAFIRKGDFEPMAEKKYQNFLEYSQLYPEYSFVFVGDNGQGDLSAGARMVVRHPDRVEAVFIHVVQPLDSTYGFDVVQAMDPDLRERIVFFNDFVEAATVAASRGFFHSIALPDIANDARSEFEVAGFSSAAAREEARKKLNISLADAAALWQKGGVTIEAPEPLPTLDEVTKC